MRFVCWSESTTRRTIGYHENAVKIASMGRAKTSAERPPPRTQRTGERRTRQRRDLASFEPPTATASLADAVSAEITSTPAISTVPRCRVRRPTLRAFETCTEPAGATRAPAEPVRGKLLPFLDGLLSDVVRLVEKVDDVGVLVRKDGLHDRVERVVDALGRGRRLRIQVLLEDAVQERRHLIDGHVDVRLDPG